MASKLFSFLNVVENSRKKLLDVVNEQGANLPNDASLATIASVVDLKTVNREAPTYDIKYYDDPEDDPAVWKRPVVYTQIDEIWDAAEPYVSEDTGLTMYPAGLYVIDTDLDNVNISAVKAVPTISNVDVNPLNDNDLVIGYLYNMTTAPASTYNVYLDIHTNDGAKYTWDRLSLKEDINSSVINHTFDNSKDLIDINGKHYKYLLVYSSVVEDDPTYDPSKNNANVNYNILYIYLIGTTFLGDGVTLPYVLFNPHFCRYNGRMSNILSKINWIKYDGYKTTFDDAFYDSLLTYNTFKYGRCFSYVSTNNIVDAKTTSYPKTLYRVEAYKHPKVTMSYYTINYSSRSHINTYITNMSPAFNVNNYTPDTGYSLPKSMVYMKHKCIHPSLLSTNSKYLSSGTPAAGTGGLAPSSGTPLLKYLLWTATDEEYDTYLQETAHTWETDTNSSYHSRSYQYPNLKAEVLAKVIKYVWYLSGTPFAAGTNKQRFEFASLNYWQATENYEVQQYDYLPEEVIVRKFNGTTAQNSYILMPAARNLYLPDVVKLEKKIDRSYDPISIHFDALTTIASGVTLPSYLKHVRAPLLTECNSSSVFNRSTLRTLELPDMFKYSLYLKAARSLEITNVLDILNKAAPLVEGESYTLTFSLGLNTNAIKESKEYKQAIERGWTVKFE